ncbi:hypothetical protein [Sphingomonas jatrophae]|uniref:Uncharacterized protein n=1 Tax=Sphingomonas jatrophae TaxID=1166337 RepID=A0A1I6LCS2_9SPHN|nr:hypothetical protein [Sphingomonas jatrophae]SFS01040.1 hypothetical protein SAMN05192580_2562 [Sphingomonas jatrophae]
MRYEEPEQSNDKLPKPARFAVIAGLSLLLWGSALSVALLVSGQAIA